jgi:hypothetical protein
MVKGLFVPANVAEPVRELELDTLDDYLKAVDGWIEAVDVMPLGVTMYVNENGLSEKLPFNGRATYLWWFHVPGVRAGAGLVGNAVLVGLPGEDGEGTEIPAATLALLTSSERYVVLMKVDGTWFRHRNINRDYWEVILWAMVKLTREPEIEEVDVATENDAEAYPYRPIPPIGQF